MNENKIKYKAYCFRLNTKTYERMINLKSKNKEISWNYLFINLIDKYENIHGRANNRKKSK